jgi:hypothetical protein
VYSITYIFCSVYSSCSVYSVFILPTDTLRLS